MRPARVAAVMALLGAGLALAACASSATPANQAGPNAATRSASASPPPLPSTAPALERDYVAVVDRVLPSVVRITTERGLGSGVVFDPRGDIVTNAHVVGAAHTFQVTLASNPAPLPASLVGTYQPDDLAVIRLDNPPGQLNPAGFGNSADLRIGDIVLAVGNPLGLSGSVTNGIVSATGRTVSEPPGPDSQGATLPDVVQTSAAINPGNSGGALVDLSGRVVGVPTLAAEDQQMGGGAAPGIGFAIPSNIVTDIATQLVRDGRVTNSHRAAIGASVVTVLGPDARPAGAGVARSDPGGPAASAGIPAGAIITKIGDQPVASASDLTHYLANQQPGARVPVVILDPTTGASRTVTVTLGELGAPG